MHGKTSLARLGLTGLALVVLALVVTLVLRRDLAEWVVAGLLEERGLRVTSLEVTELNWRRAAVHRFSVEASGLSARVERIELGYSIPGLVSGRLSSVVVTDADLSLDTDSPWLESLQGDRGVTVPTSGSETSGTSLRRLVPDVDVHRARLRLNTAIGPVELKADGKLRRENADALKGTFDLFASAAQGESRAAIDIMVSSDLSFQADMSLREGNLDVGGLTLRGLSGNLTAEFDAAVDRFRQLEAGLRLDSLSGGLSAELALSPLRLSLDATLEQQDIVFAIGMEAPELPDDVLQASLSGRLSREEQGTELSASVLIETPASLPVFSRFPLTRPQSGAVTIKADLETRLPDFWTMSASGSDAAPPSRWLQSVVSLDSDLALRIQGLSHAAGLHDLSMETAGRLELDENEIRFSLSRPLTAAVPALPASLSEGLSVPEALQDWLASPWETRISSLEGKPLIRADRAGMNGGPYMVAAVIATTAERLSVTSNVTGEIRTGAADWSLGGPATVTARGLPLEATGEVAGAMDIDFKGHFTSALESTELEGEVVVASAEISSRDARLGGFFARGRLGAALAGRALHISATDAFGITAQSLTTENAVSTTPLNVQLTSLDVGLDLDDGKLRPNVTATLAPAGFSITAGGRDVPLETASLELKILPDQAGITRLIARTDSVVLPQERLRVPGISVTGTLDGETGVFEGRLEDLMLEDTGRTRRFDPLQMSGGFRRDPDGLIHFTARGRAFEEALSFQVSGRSDPARGVSMEITLPVHEFAGKALHLKDLSWISDVRLDAGVFAGRVSVESVPDGLNGKARLTSEGLAGEILGFPFSGLSLVVELDRLWPPRTGVPISIDLTGINPGLPLQDLRFEGSFSDDDPFSLDIREAALNILGARISVTDGEVALLDGTAELPIRITGLDLAEILKAADLGDVEVSGRLTGDLPISLEDGAVVVRHSRLAATGPGVLRIRSEQVSTFLSGYGDEVSSMLRALEDFHYEDLSLTIEKTAGDDLTLLLSILGSNPSVLDGQPFRINLNLESNIGQILGTLGEALELSKDLLSRRFSLH